MIVSIYKCNCVTVILIYKFLIKKGVRTALLESEDNECPDCKEKGSSPGSLIPNRFLRNSVNAFKNRTGYKASSQIKKGNLLTIIYSYPTNYKVRVFILELNQQTKEVQENKQPENTPDKESEKETAEAKVEIEKTETEEKVAPETEDKEKEDLETKPNDSLEKQHPEDESTGEVDMENMETKHKNQNITNSPTHEDSDYEDNIVVTVPSASDTRTEKYLTRRHGSSHPKPPGIDQSSPKTKHQVFVFLIYMS